MKAYPLLIYSDYFMMLSIIPHPAYIFSVETHRINHPSLQNKNTVVTLCQAKFKG